MVEEVAPGASDTEDAGAAPSPRPATTRVGHRRSAPALDADPASNARRRVLESRLPEEEDEVDGVRVLSPTSGGVRGPAAPRGAAAATRALPADPRAYRGATPVDAASHVPGSARSPRPAYAASTISATGRASALGHEARGLGAFERSGGPGAPGNPFADRPAATLSLSPRMTAVFGGLFGLATITTIIALLIQGVPPRDDRAAAVLDPSALPTQAAPEAAPAPQLPKKRARTKIPGPWRVADLAKDPTVRIVEDAIGKRSFIVALGEKGIAKDQVYRVLKAFEGVRKFDKTSKKDRFIAAIDRQSGELRGFEYVVSTFEIFQAKEELGLLKGQALDLKIAEEEVVGSFYIGKNLARSIEFGGFEPSLAKALDEALAGRMSTESFEEGGTVRVIATEMTALGDFAKYKGIVALEVRPADPAGTPVRAYAFDGTGSHGYFDERGRQPDGGGWTSPVPGAPITSKFNPKRMHPVLKKVMPHNGTDFGAATGTPVYATFRGKISHYGPAGACGNMVGIAHPGDIETMYCHLSKFAPGLKVGSPIGTRQLVGYVGSTGRSTGPHLHFGAKKDGKYIDPESLKIDGFRVIPVSERPLFLTRKAELDARLDAIPFADPPPPEPKTEPAAPQADVAASDPSADDDDEPTSKKAPTSTGASAIEEGEDIVGPDLGAPARGPTP